MKILLRILVIIVVLFVFPSMVNSQKLIEFDTVFVNSNSADFFEKNPVVQKIEYSITNQQSKFVSVFLKSDWADTSFGRLPSHYFNLNFAGDVYRFEKKYGYFAAPEKEAHLIIQKKGLVFPDLSCMLDAGSAHCSVSRGSLFLNNFFEM